MSVTDRRSAAVSPRPIDAQTIHRFMTVLYRPYGTTSTARRVPL
jgi:hypothetical protein